MKHEDLETLKWFIGTAGALTIFLIGAVGFLLRVTYKIGGVAQEIREVGEKVTGIKANADKVPVLENRIGTVEAVQTRFLDDLRSLRHKTGNPSVPDFSAEG